MTTATPTSTTEQAPKRGFYVSIQVKLAIVFTLIFSIVFAGSFIWFYNYAIGVAKGQINDNLDHALVAGAAKIDGDSVMELYNNAQPTLFSDRGDSDPENDVYYTDDPNYWVIADWLWTIRTLDPNAIPWVYVRADPATDPEGFYYVVDGMSDADPLPSYTVNFKEYDTAITGDLFVGLQHTALFLDEPYEWEGKSWVSGYTPIYDSSGKVVAGLGIDYLAQYLVDIDHQIRNLAIPAFIITYIVMFGLVYLSSRILTRPITHLTRIAEQIGEGDYDQNFASIRNRRVPDEIDTLAEVFQIMIGKVAKREEKLKQQVAELQIQIDHSKRDEQVKEIVDNDFFQSLQSKAFEMRSRRREQETD